MDTRSSPLTPGDGAGGAAEADATAGVTALYRAHAVGLIRLAVIMLGERGAAEDVVQDAFFGLYRHWAGLADPGKALTYVRSAVLNRCRNALRQRGRSVRQEAVGAPMATAASESAEAAVLVSEEHQQVLAADFRRHRHPPARSRLGNRVVPAAHRARHRRPGAAGHAVGPG